MTEKDERFCANWKYARRKGKGWFITWFTIISGAGITALHLINIWGCECDSIFVKFSGTVLLENILKDLLAGLIAVLLVGGLFGWAIWNRNEGRYKRLNFYS